LLLLSNEGIRKFSLVTVEDVIGDVIKIGDAQFDRGD
jgi:hypothetical protein